MTFSIWPLANLSLQTPQLELREPNRAELMALAELAARGIEREGKPTFLTPWTRLEPAARSLYVMQAQWGCWAEWTPDDWVLGLGVFVDGQVAGRVSLRAQQFRVLREVKTASWLGLEFQGHGYGTEARAALLYFAFEHLGAEYAASEVFESNDASLGVSRKLGYQSDGISRDVLDGGVMVSQRLRLSAARWQECRPDTPVTVRGAEACLPLFGV